MTPRTKSISRRRFVRAAAGAGAFGLAGCLDGGGTGTGTGTEGGTGTLEVLHGWTGGDGKTAVNNLTSVFEEEYPDVNTEFNPIGGGGNQNLDNVVANRLSNNNPPSAFANWPGKNLQRYEGALGTVDDVWEEHGFQDSHVQEAVDLHQQNGSFRAVPLGSHRLNNLFYNVSVVEEAGVDPSGIDSVDALLTAMDTVGSETDKAPMAHLMSGTWGTTQLWAAIMLGQEGYQPYMDFIEGNGSESAVRSTFQTLKTILQNHITDDASSLDLTASNNKIIDGEAAFIHQGNWAAGAFRNAEDFDYDSEWGAVAFPGTSNMYTLHFDSFLYPSNNPSPEVAKTWLGFVGNESAQVAFNRYKGSIPTRTDVSMDEFGPYLKQTAEDFADAEHRPPTLQHGLAVTSNKMTALNDVISNQFTGPYNVDQATSGFLDAV